jgi:NAD(P)H-flavin reductase
VLHLSSPIGQGLTLPSGPGPDLLLLAGGTGLAPLKAIIEQLVREGDERKVTLILGTAFRYELYDLDALRGLASQHRRLTVLCALSSDPTLGEPHTVVEAALRSGSWHDCLIYICGSTGMVDATRRALLSHGYAPEQLRVEQYDGTTYAPLQGHRHP